MIPNEKLKLLGLLSISFFLQWYLANTWIAEFLYRRIEVSTPVSGFLRVREGLYLYENGLDPYSGGVFYQSPLLLILNYCCELLGGISVTRFVYTSISIMGGLFVYLIAKQARVLDPNQVLSTCSPLWISVIYLLNPLTFLPGIACSADMILNFTTLMTIYFASCGSYAIYACCMALTVFINPSALLLFFPSYLILKKCNSSIKFRQIFVVFLFYLAGLIITSGFFLNSLSFLKIPFRVYLDSHDLTPNLGLWWYFFTEMFNEFRTFFLFVFAILPLMFVLPVSIRLYYLPLPITIALIGLHSLFKAYPSICDLSIFLSLLPIFNKVQDRMRYSLLTNNAIVFALVLGSAFYHSWITLGCGNANFYYASNLILALGLSLKIMDFLKALLLVDWYANHPQHGNIPLKQVQ